jgi:hypothetical protein
VSPPQHNVALGLWGSNHYGEARLDSACDEGTNNVYDNVPHPELSKEGWSFMSISRSNTTGRIEVGVNLVKTFEGGQFNNGGLCLFDPAALFTAIEISYPMLISPIMLIPEAIPFASVQVCCIASRGCCERKWYRAV